MKGLKITALIAMGVATVCVFTSAIAIPSSPAGWYVEGNVGSSRVSNVTYATGNSIKSSGRAFNINGGYKFTPFFSAEIGYTTYASATASVNNVNVAVDNHYSYDAAGKIILPFADSGAELFAKLGLAELKSRVKVQDQRYVTANGIIVNSGSRSASGYYFGLGGAYTFWQGIAANGQWQRAKGNSTTGNYDLFSLGLSYTFA